MKAAKQTPSVFLNSSPESGSKNNRLTMFDSIIGNENVKLFLEKSIKADRLSHAYLFIGPAHVGKMALARAFAEQLLIIKGQKVQSLEAHPDVTLVGLLPDEKTGESKSTITIEQIRSLREQLSYSSLLPTAKIAIIADADRMTIEASNALLKTLEEPRGNTVIILLASDSRRIPATVQSRSQLIRFHLVPAALLEKSLIGRGVEKSEARRLAVIARGRPGIAIQFVKNPDSYDEFVGEVRERIVLLKKPLFERYIWTENRMKKLKAEKLAEEYRLWREILRDALLHSLAIKEFVNFDFDHIPADTASLVQSLHRLSESQDASRFHVDPRLSLEYVLSAVHEVK